MSAPPQAIDLPLRYRLVLAIYATGYTIFEALRSGGWRYLQQRCGFAYPQRNDQPIWIHAASVGEVITALPLIAGLQQRYPNLPLLITTATPTGAQTASQRLGSNVEHRYQPLDGRGAVARFLDRSNPRAALILETELWPQLFWGCKQRQIPLVVINGRLSRRTLEAPTWLQPIYRATLAHTSAILARSEGDRTGFEQLGAVPERVETIGNLKFATPVGYADQIEAQSEPPINRPYLLAASTHDDEELRLATAWLDQPLPDHLLLIVPRHPVRRDAILAQLKRLDTNIAVRSHGDPVTADTRIYLADTMGELLWFMQYAAVVLMGGSLVPHGGQNLLEPARLGRPILLGPYMDNFTDARDALLQAGGCLEVQDAHQWLEQCRELIAEPERARELGQQAAEYMMQQADITTRYLERLEQLIDFS